MRRDRGLAAHPADLDGDLASIESSFGVLADAVTPPPRPGSASCAPRRRPPPVILVDGDVIAPSRGSTPQDRPNGDQFGVRGGSRGFELATLNIKHFPMFRGLKAPFELRRS